jgi:deoxyribose-phosphate aldolase
MSPVTNDPDSQDHGQDQDHSRDQGGRVLSRAKVAKMIDHTLLAPTATGTDVIALVEEGLRLGVYAVCVSPSMLPLDSRGLTVAAVCGFPSGKHATEIKVHEARLAARRGASEVDIVMDLGAALAGQWAYVEDQLTQVRRALGSGPLIKVIIESAILDDRQVEQACAASKRAGADFVKTSTGFHPSGGATTHAVGLMAASVGGRLGVKASGGIRDAATALAMISAGATRLGLSSTEAVLDGLKT